MSRYTVWSVGRDGNRSDVFSHDSPSEVLAAKAAEERWNKRVGSRRTVGITDNENPESGDVSDRLAEEK